MTELSTLTFDILAKDRASDTVDKIGKKFDGLSGTMKGLSKGVALLGGAFAAVQIGNLFGDFISEARESQRVGNLTANVIKQTGGVAKITADQVGDLAQSISNKTGIDDEAIQTSANLLLTFKNIHNEVGKGSDIFNRATAATQDLAAAGFGDADSAAKQLGKALNDPIKGMAALGKAGVTFSEDQKKQIEGFVKVGDLLSAQKIIMGEVESQVGGAAQAAADPMQKLGVIIDNVKEDIGTALLPVLETAAEWLGEHIPAAIQTLTGWFDTGKIAVEALVAAFNGEGVTSDGFVGFMENVGVVSRQVFDYFQSAVLPRLKEFGSFIMDTVVPALGTMAGFVKDNLDFFGPFAATILAIVAAMKLWAIAQAVMDALWAVSPIGLVIIAIAALVAGVIYAYHHFETFRNIVDTAWDVIQNAAKFAWENVIKPVFGFLVGAVQEAWHNFNVFKDTVSTVWDNVKQFVTSGVNKVVTTVFWMAEQILNAATSAFGWVPGIGDKLNEARGKFEIFRDQVNRALGGINDESIKITADMVAREMVSGGNAIALGTAVGRMAGGGPVRGPGTGTSDTAGIYALANGEHVFTAKEVNAMGGQGAVTAFRKSLVGMAAGGPVGLGVHAALPDPNWLAGKATEFRDRSADKFEDRVLAAAARAMATTGGVGVAQYLGGGRVSIMGKLLDATTANIFQRASAMLGGLQLMQGSWSNSVAASGGTHSGAGAMDVAPIASTWDRAVSVIRSLGGIAWHRTPAQGPWGHHIHSITPGVPGLSPSAAAQVADFRRGGDGLGGMFRGGPVSYDTGGWLKPGWTAAYNGTGRSERVLGPSDGGNTYHVTLNVGGSVATANDLADAFVARVIQRTRRGDLVTAA